ncbi:MAG: response regulator [Promethearchaeota archaeon]
MIDLFIVDDNIFIMKLYLEFLKNAQFNVIDSAVDGREAVSKYKKSAVRPDIVIMDYNMPFKNGIDAAKEILQINKNAKIVIVSADYRVKEEALSSGVLDFIEKPFDLNEFNQKLLRIYNKKNN